MKHIVVDLEMNQVAYDSEVRKICIMETIEIGAVMLDEELQEVSSFRTYVKPEYNEKIVPRISRLTGITDEMIVDAPNFTTAFKQFSDWCLSGKDQLIIYAWSTTDYQQIVREMELKQYVMSEEEHQLMDEEWTDFQDEFDCQLGFEKQLSLKMALEIAGIDFGGHEHDALDDARNTAKLLEIYLDQNLFNQTLKKIEDVMKPSSLGNTVGSMIDLSKITFA